MTTKRKLILSTPMKRGTPVPECPTVSSMRDTDGNTTSDGYVLVANELPDYEKQHPIVGVVEPENILVTKREEQLFEAVELLNNKLTDLIARVDELEEKISPKPQIKPEKLPMRDREYVVKEGDTVALIARELYGNPGNFKILMVYNKLQDGVPLQPGQVLKIPAIGAYA